VIGGQNEGRLGGVEALERKGGSRLLKDADERPAHGARHLRCSGFVNVVLLLQRGDEGGERVHGPRNEVMASEFVEILRARAPLLWTRISTDSRPDVSLMISLLVEMGVQLQSRPSGFACLKVLVDNLEFIEQRLRDGPPASDAAPPPQNDEPPSPEAPPQVRTVDEPIDESLHCANTLIAEAHERMVSCVLTSFRTDTGLIMLENELSLFNEEEPDTVPAWVVRMRETWSSRLHSKVLDDFFEALDLWVLSQSQFSQGS